MDDMPYCVEGKHVGVIISNVCWLEIQRILYRLFFKSTSFMVAAALFDNDNDNNNDCDEVDGGKPESGTQDIGPKGSPSPKLSSLSSIGKCMLSRKGPLAQQNSQKWKTQRQHIREHCGN
jgi:hypothetical protein